MRLWTSWSGFITSQHIPFMTASCSRGESELPPSHSSHRPITYARLGTCAVTVTPFTMYHCHIVYHPSCFRLWLTRRADPMKLPARFFSFAHSLWPLIAAMSPALTLPENFIGLPKNKKLPVTLLSGFLVSYVRLLHYLSRVLISYPWLGKWKDNALRAYSSLARPWPQDCCH